MDADESGVRTDGSQAASPERRTRRRRRESSGAHDSSRKFTKYFLIPLGVLAVLGLIGYFAFHPIRNQLRRMKAEASVKEAEADLAAENYELAYRKVTVAVSLAAGNPRVQLAAARTYTKLGLPEALNFWKPALAGPSITTEDRLAYVDACLRFLRADLAAEELDALDSTIGKSPSFQRRVVGYYLLCRDYESAVPYARQAQTANPKDEEFEYLLGRCLIGSKRSDYVEEGRRLLTSIALSPGAWQFEAAQLLINTGKLPTAEARQIARSLEKRSDLMLSRKLVIASLRMTGDREQREKAVTTMLVDWPATDDTERIALGSWGLSMEAPSSVKKYLSTLNTTNAQLRMLAARAYADDGDWTGLDSYLSTQGSAIHEVDKRGLSALREAKQGAADKVRAELQAAMASAISAPAREQATRFSEVSDWAMKAGDPEFAVEALLPLLEVPAHTAWAGRRILDVGSNFKSYAATFPALKALQAYAPNDTSIQVSFAIAGTYLGHDPAKVLDVASKVAADVSPTDWKVVLHAFALSRSGNKTGGLERLEAWTGSVDDLPPMFQVMVAYVRAQGGQRAGARDLTLRINRSPLMIEAARLLDEIQ